MRKKAFAPAIQLIAAALLFWGLSATAQAKQVDSIAAVVDSKVITESELMRTIAPIVSQYSSVYSGEELDEKIRKLRHETLEQMVQNELLLLEAKRQKLEVSDLDIDQKIKEIRQRVKDKDEFDRAVEREYGTKTDFRDAIRNQIMVKALLMRDINPRVTVSFREIEDFYAQHADQYKEPDKVRVRHFMLKKTDAVGWKELEAKVEEYRKQVEGGADFEKLIREHSEGPAAAEGGDMGFVARGKILKQLEEQAFSLDTGKLSAPIKSDLGCHLIRVEAAKKARVVPLQEVSADIEDQLTREKRKKAVQAYTEKIKSRYHVEVYF